MSEDFVDVSWRGLEVAHRARLRVDAAGRGHVEHGTPMPIGTRLALATADGGTLAAVVTAVREQVGGRSEPPGMDLEIAAEGAARAWWQARVSAAIASAPPSAPSDVADASSSEPPAVDDSGAGRTEVMAAVEVPPELLAAAEAVPAELADDGRRTTVMAAVDIDAIVAASADAAPEDTTGDEPASAGGGDKKKAKGGKRKRGR